jgi:hypothetical protein
LKRKRKKLHDSKLASTPNETLNQPSGKTMGIEAGAYLM